MEQPKDQTNNLENQRFAVAMRRRKEGDLIGALSVLRNLDEDGSENAEVKAQTGAVYFDMELYEQSLEYWFAYLASSDSAKVKMRAYSAISACFCMLGDFRSMAFYAELEFSLEPNEPQEYDKVLTDYYDYVYDVMGGGYYVSYPETRIPARRLMYESDGLTDEKKFAEAAEKLALVQKESEYYPEARFRLARCLYAEDKKKEYAGVLEELIAEYPEDAFANMGYGFYLLDRGDYDAGRYYLKKAAQGELFDEEDYYMVGVDLCLIGSEEDAFLPFERALEINSYYTSALFMYGVLNFNSGDYETAARYFKTVYQLTTNPLAKRYFALADKKISVRLEYDLYPTEELMNDIENEIFDIADGGRKAVADAGEEKLKDLVDWLAFCEELAVKALIEALFAYGSQGIRNYVLKKMFSLKTSTEDKMKVIEELVYNGYGGRVAFVAENLLIRADLVTGDFEKTNEHVFRRALAFASARVCIFENDLSKLRDRAYEIYDKLKDNGLLKKANDHKALACVIAIKSGLDAKDKSVYRLFFDTTEKKVEKMLALIDGETE